jgi:flagellar biosynthesis protein FlhB
MASRIYFKFVLWQQHNVYIIIVYVSPKWSWIILNNTYKRQIFGCVSFYEFLKQNWEYLLYSLTNYIWLRINTD